MIGVWREFTSKRHTIFSRQILGPWLLLTDRVTMQVA